MDESESPGRSHVIVMGATKQASSPTQAGVGGCYVEASSDAGELDWIASVIGELANFAASQGDAVLRDRAQAAMQAFAVQRRSMGKRMAATHIVKLVVHPGYKHLTNSQVGMY